MITIAILVNNVLSFYIPLSYPAFALLLWWTIVRANRSGAYPMYKMVVRNILQAFNNHKWAYLPLVLILMMSIPVVTPFMFTWQVRDLFKKKAIRNKNAGARDINNDITVSPEQPGFETEFSETNNPLPEINTPQNPNLN